MPWRTFSLEGLGLDVGDFTFAFDSDLGEIAGSAILTPARYNGRHAAQHSSVGTTFLYYRYRKEQKRAITSGDETGSNRQ
jgi:hypothetical protein